MYEQSAAWLWSSARASSENGLGGATVAAPPAHVQLVASLLNGEGALHPGGRVARDGAEVGLLARLQRDGQLGRLAGADERGLLPADLEVVGDVARVLHGEGHRAVRNARLRELELELRRRDRDSRAGRVRPGRE